MKHSVFPGSRSGTVKIPASKSMAHRLLIAAALGKDSKILHFDGFSNDIGATIVCLRALGAEITELGGGSWRVAPVGTVADDPLRTRYEDRKNGRSARLQREIVR